MIGYSPIDFDDPIEVPIPRKKEIVADKPRIIERVPINRSPKSRSLMKIPSAISSCSSLSWVSLR